MAGGGQCATRPVKTEGLTCIDKNILVLAKQLRYNGLYNPKPLAPLPERPSMKDLVYPLLSAEERNDEFLMASLARLAPPEENPLFHAELLEFFVHLQAGEEEARAYWHDIIANATQLNSSLDRPLGLRVAIFDYFLNLNTVLSSPLLVEVHIFKEAERLAMVDGLTGLSNRRAFDIAIRKELKRSSRYDKDFALIMIDVDNFKALNDTHGHPLGDEVLRKMAVAFSSIMREEDSAYRYGGEEFAIILPETAEEGAMAFAGRMRARLHNDEFLRSYSVTVSGGIAPYPYAGVRAEELLESADKALYQAKAQGKDRFVNAVSMNKRRRPRFEEPWPLRCRRIEQTSLDDDGGPLICTRNVSLGGLGVDLPEDYALDDQVVLDLGTPAGQITIVGKVVWKGAKSGGLWSYGIEFCDLKAQQQQLMMKVLPSDYFAPDKGK